METIVIAKLKNREDADFLTQFVKKIHGKATVLHKADLDKEHKIFAGLIDEGMNSGEVSLDEIYKKLRQ